MITYLVILALLGVLEVCYFMVADRFNIIDKPNERSSHTRIVLRGGGIIFTIALWIWSAWYGFNYPWLLAGVTLAAGISFVDDIHSLPDSLRLVAHFVAMFLVFQEVGILQWDMWWMLAIKNEELRIKSGVGFIDETMLIVILLSVLVFCFFNFRQKAKCFAGDVGSIGMALILVFCIGRLMYVTGDITWIVLYLLYGLDGMLTICHRIMLHENLGEAHRKHAYQLMANELKMSHVTVSLIYMGLQLAVSLGFIYLIPNTIVAHWIYLVAAALILAVAYVLFKMKYYHLHEEYLASLKK